jgi:hypothetical protein
VPGPTGQSTLENQKNLLAVAVVLGRGFVGIVASIPLQK